MKRLDEIPAGVRVRKPSAIVFDYAYGRIGEVVRERIDGRERVGVLWDGALAVFEYPGETEFDDEVFPFTVPAA